MSIFEDREDALYEDFLHDPDTRLIAPPADSDRGVEFHFSGEWRECRIWEGYLDSSLILLKVAVEEFPRMNQLIFPALFNLRHGMEVALKWHIRYAGGSIPKRAGHDLSVLIEAFRQTAEGLDEAETYISETMLSNISELAQIDPRAVAFRYASEIDGSPIEIMPEIWDITRLYFATSTLAVCFDDLSNLIERSWQSNA
ncbi:hypothetical protein D2T29_06620 [Sinirhodobacter populi]|uniref:HEPN domain-containing protein n=1 Tax=Paenirhodobacter populi TaxID=2306993 RepID=A0A443KKR1_9RHOB|nr:hypothetical protein [Sinirhodobacter populi]RWR33326.1 hypothetical protein D2T29_06620 [Sinirhodobacter populi]